MHLQLQLSLPRDARYVSIMRNVASNLLRDLDAPEDAVDDLRLALSEACANVVLHATGVDDYSANLTVDHQGCEVEIVDRGPGLGGERPDLNVLDSAVALPDAGLDAEHGRGLAMIGALVDDLEFVREDSTTRVRLTKRWDELGVPPDFEPDEQTVANTCTPGADG